MAKLEPVDFAIIGSGMGGAAFAWQISRLAPRLKVLCLERGGWLKSENMPALTDTWQSAGIGKWATSPNVRLGAGGNPHSADYPIDDSGSPIKPLMWNGIGGSTINWAAHTSHALIEVPTVASAQPADTCEMLSAALPGRRTVPYDVTRPAKDARTDSWSPARSRAAG